YFIGSHFGWRYMFVVGGSPALLVALMQRGVHEPERWRSKKEELGDTLKMHHSFLALFTPKYRRRSILNATFMLASIIGLWGGSVYVPTAITFLAAETNHTAVEAARLASYATGLLASGTILGALVVPFITDRIGRRLTLGVFFAMMAIFIYL